MPRYNNPETFAQSYHDIVMKVGMEGKEWRVPASGPMPTEKIGVTEFSGIERLKKLRGHFYAFKGSLKRYSKEENNKFYEIYLASTKVAFVLDEKEVAAYFRPTDNSWHAQALSLGGEVGSDGIAKQVPQSDAVAASLARMAALIDLEDI